LEDFSVDLGVSPGEDLEDDRGVEFRFRVLLARSPLLELPPEEATAAAVRFEVRGVVGILMLVMVSEVD